MACVIIVAYENGGFISFDSGFDRSLSKLLKFKFELFNGLRPSSLENIWNPFKLLLEPLLMLEERPLDAEWLMLLFCSSFVRLSRCFLGFGSFEDSISRILFEIFGCASGKMNIICEPPISMTAPEYSGVALELGPHGILILSTFAPFLPLTCNSQNLEFKL